MFKTRRFAPFAIFLAALLVGSPAIAQNDEVRYSLFNDIETTFKAANEMKAQILALIQKKKRRKFWGRIVPFSVFE